MNQYNPFSTFFLSIPAKGYSYVGKDGPSGWNTYAIYNNEIINWVENKPKDSVKYSEINFVYSFSPELEMLFLLRWQ